MRRTCFCDFVTTGPLGLSSELKGRRQRRRWRRRWNSQPRPSKPIPRHPGTTYPVRVSPHSAKKNKTQGIACAVPIIFWVAQCSTKAKMKPLGKQTCISKYASSLERILHIYIYIYIHHVSSCRTPSNAEIAFVDPCNGSAMVKKQMLPGCKYTHKK